MKSIVIKKMVPKFDTDAISIGLPYRIVVNGITYVGVFYMIDEDRLEFKYFEGEKINFVIILPTIDDISIYPFDLDDPADESPKELVEKDEPDIKSFYIRDMCSSPYTKYPLFVRKNGELVINYDFMEKLLYDDSILIEIGFGLKCYNSGVIHTFKSKDVRIHVGGTTLTGKIFNEYKDVVTCVEIRAGDWTQLKWAHVNIKTRKDATNDSVNE